MGESEWLTSGEPAAMIAWLHGCGTLEEWATASDAARVAHGVATDRKFLLFACACRRLIGGDYGWEDDNGWAETERAGHHDTRRDDWPAVQYARLFLDDTGLDLAKAADALRDIIGNPWRRVAVVPAWITPQVLTLAEAAYEDRKRKCVCESGYTWQRDRTPGREWSRGRPCDACRRTGTIDDGTLDPFRLALVADAMEEAGCVGEGDEAVGGVYVCERCAASTAVDYSVGIRCGRCGSEFCQKRRRRDLPHPLLEHLRSPAPKYRGMWSIDCILGKA